jgi:hypothetical protein
MEGVEKGHSVSTVFEIIWPAGRFDESSRFVVNELVD